MSVEMEYTGPGTKPGNIFVDENEVAPLEQTGLWAKAAKKSKSEAAKPEKEVTNG